MELRLECDGWSSGPVSLAVGFRQRWRGLRPRSQGDGLVLAGKSINTIGMVEGLWMVGITDVGYVVGVRYARPLRFFRLAGANLVLELPAGRPPPPIGVPLSARDYQVGQKRLRKSRPAAESFETTSSMDASS